jgi:hypothetical protein
MLRTAYTVPFAKGDAMSSTMKIAGSFSRIAVLGLSAFAASCTAGAVVYEARIVPVRPDRICTREYVPVCGETRGDQRTFGNACEADAAGYRIAYGGECRRGPPRGPRPISGPVYGPGYGPGPSRPQQSDRICSRQYEPVCARRGDRERTFGNACEAGNAGFRIVDRGPC